MDFHKLITRYKQFGGFRLVVEYANVGALWPGIKAFFKCFIERKSFKPVYPEVLKRVEPMLVAKYSHIVQEYKSSISSRNEIAGSARNESASTGSATIKPIWFCWLQGLEQAPPIVHACYNSLKKHLADREIKVIDNENWKEYVELPEFIVKKWEKKRIPAALFSDLLRLELLIKYGGTWIDSTVLCTGFNGSSSLSGSTSSPTIQEYLDADLFLFQYTKQGSIPVSISNWFITACSNNEVLMVLRDMLFAYWKDYDCTLDYYIFHLFFGFLSKEYPEEIAAMPYGQSMNSLVIMHHLGDKFDLEKWDKLTQRVCFHKLAFRVSDNVKADKEDYFNKIVQMYS